MGWFDTALSIGTTIGKIAGALSGGSQSFVDFGFPGKINASLGELVFYNDPTTGNTMALNQSVSSPVSLSFPSDPLVGTDFTELILPIASKINVVPAFQHGAASGVDQFFVTPTPNMSDDAADGPDINIHSSSSATVAPGVNFSVGPYITANLNASDRTIQIGVIGALTLTGIVLLNIRGSGNTFVRIINAIRKNTVRSDDPTTITVDIPAGIDIDQGLTFIEVTAAVNGLSSSDAARFGRVEPLTDDDIVMLKSFR